MRRKTWKVRGWMAAALVCVWTASWSHGAVIYVESFTSSDRGWTGTEDLDVEWHPSGVSPGSLQGTFTDPGLFSQWGSYYADSSASDGAFVGNYLAVNATGFRLDFLAQDVTPSDLTLYLHGGGFTFLAALTTPGVGSWTSYTVPFTLGPWLGGSQAQFETMLSNVSWVRLEVGSSGPDTQRYYLDNFELTGDIINGGTSAIPEPGQGLLLLGAILILGMRRRLIFAVRS